MSEKRIFLTTEDVRNVLNGRMTRRTFPVKCHSNRYHIDKPLADWPLSKGIRQYKNGDFYETYQNGVDSCTSSDIRHEYGRAGDELWVCETWCYCPRCGLVNFKAQHDNLHCTDCDAILDTLWRPSIFMYREFSRIQLEITSVRIERVQEIKNFEAVMEGVEATGIYTTQTARANFLKLWDLIYAKRGYSWDSNPFVWVVDFKVKR